MPRNEMAALLKELGAPIPETKQAPAGTPELAAAGNLKCRRCGRIAPKMARARPFPAAWASRFTPPSAAVFREWIGQGTKVIDGGT